MGHDQTDDAADEAAPGWHDEDEPENSDWQIKGSVEHDITSFLVDWYWCKECAPKGDERLRLMWGAG